AAGRHQVRRPDGSDRTARHPSVAQGPVRRRPDRAADDLCPGARGGILRHAGGAQCALSGGQRRLPHADHYSGHCSKCAFHDEKDSGNMMITRKAMGRRTMLRGMGTVMALPLLEAMSASAKAAEEAAATRKRLQVIYTPNGMMMQNWTPTSNETGFAYSPILKPLEPYRNKITVFTDL